jgi:hypothetical protein
MDIKREKKWFNVSPTRTRAAGFFLTEALLALALLGLLLILIAKFEYYAGVRVKSLEREYVANVAAETQFERLKAGLAVLDSKTFRQQYPGLDLEYQIQSTEGKGVVTVKTVEPEPRVLVQLVGPVPRFILQPGGKP